MVRGALRGIVATVVMTTVYAGRPELPFPPKVVAHNLGVPWWPLHLTIGAGLGALQEALDAPPVAFALVVWAASYGTTLPALGLYPALAEDDRTRARLGAVAHAVFGAVL
jgi:hypothetical protein